MKRKILIASLFATLMLLVPVTSVVGISDISLNRKIEKIEDDNTITETYDNEDCECQVVNRYDLFRVKLLLVRLKVFTNILLLRFGHIPEIKEKCEEILDLINSDFPIICAILESVWNQYKYIINILDDLISKYEDNPIISGIIIIFLAYPLDNIAFIVLSLGAAFGCEWVPEP